MSECAVEKAGAALIDPIVVAHAERGAEEDSLLIAGRPLERSILGVLGDGHSIEVATAWPSC